MLKWMISDLLPLAHDNTRFRTPPLKIQYLGGTMDTVPKIEILFFCTQKRHIK